MTTSLRKRSPLLAAALAAAAIPAVAMAAGPTTKVTGPDHPAVGERFAVGASGHTGAKRVLQVTIHRHGKCKSTYGGEKDSGSFVAIAKFVGPGDYSAKRSGLRFTGKTNGHYCAYLGNPNASIYATPRARSDKHFQVVE